MQICKIIGNVVATAKNRHLVGKKLMLVQPLSLDGKFMGKELIAIDSVGAGIGDDVLVISEGGSAQIVLQNKKMPVQTVIVGIVDGIDIPKEK